MRSRARAVGRGRFGTHLEVYPRPNGEVYLCGLGGSETVSAARLRAGERPPGAVHADPARVAAGLAAFAHMSASLGRGSDAAAAAAEAATACMRPCTPDGLPSMGALPGHVRGAYLSAGHNCWGILWAPVSGKAMAELLLDGEAACVDLCPFAPGRFVPDKTRRGRARGHAPVGEQW